MPMTRAEKTEHLGQVQAVFEAANTVYLVSLAGLKVNEVNSLRGSLREVGGGLRVVRNRLATRTLGAEAEALRPHFVGPTALAHHPTEPVALAKVLTKFAKEHPNLAIRAGFLEKREVVDADGVKTLSELPDLDGTRAMLAGLIATPATQLVRLLSTPATQLARVLQARSEKE
jgi:large subunit ribosomal protein L10